MKYSLLSVLFLLGGCAIQGEVFRLQQRMKAWNALLPQEQQALFARNDTNAVGAWLDAQASDPAFAQKLKTLREDEAIMSFSGVQTAHFFYNTLLKDLAKFSYEELIKNINAEEFSQFLSTPDGSALLNNKKLQGVFAAARSQYEMPAFTDADILRYHRQKSLPAHLYIVVYDTLAFAAKNNTYADVMAGRYDSTAAALDALAKNAKSRRPQTRRTAQARLDEWNYILSRAQTPPMPPQGFLKMIARDILPEMDAGVRSATLKNLHSRFNITAES